MAAAAGWVYNALFGEEIDLVSARFDSDRYQPSVEDVLAVKDDLHKITTLPYELVDTIVDMAQYWPHTSTRTIQESTVYGSNPKLENQFILRAFPLGCPSHMEEPNFNEYQIRTPSFVEYATDLPSPWPVSRHNPAEATEEVLANWSSKTLPKGRNPCRKIVFTIKSRDQGSGGGQGHQGTYQGSYTWFDVGLERLSATREPASGTSPIAEIQRSVANLGMKSRSVETMKPIHAPLPEFALCRDVKDSTNPIKVLSEYITCNLRTISPVTNTMSEKDAESTFHHDLLPSSMALQRNTTATRAYKTYKIIWSFDDSVVPDSLEAAELDKQGRGKDTATGEFVRKLEIGDVVTVWAKSRFPGWVNNVDEVKMDIYWAV